MAICASSLCPTSRSGTSLRFGWQSWFFITGKLFRCGQSRGQPLSRWARQSNKECMKELNRNLRMPQSFTVSKDRLMKTRLLRILSICFFGYGGFVFAQSPEFMMEDCRNLSRLFFDDFTAQSDVKYEGQRSDGSHFVNGTIFIADKAEFFQCSYAKSGRRLVDFWAKEHSWPDFAVGGANPHKGE
jgi:hypothetical protein